MFKPLNVSSLTSACSRRASFAKARVAVVAVVAASAVLLVGCASNPAGTPVAGQLDAFIRMRANADGSTVFANWWVTIFAVVPGERPREIMKLEGFNAGRFAKKPDGSADFISREVAYYKDSKTGEILKEWANPFTGEKNVVLQVANDPVNQRYAAPKAGEPGRYPFMVSGDDVFLRLDVPLAYPNALQPADYPAESSGPTYLASEHFTFFSSAKDLRDRSKTSVPATYAWARTGPWLPWMKMGQRPGYLMYSGHGRKYPTFAELPADIQAYTRANFPLYVTAPDVFATPNETSWSYYKKLNPKK
jgi:hypothetical protein